eukprot:3444790-Rhodomonas_salina.3
MSSLVFSREWHCEHFPTCQRLTFGAGSTWMRSAATSWSNGNLWRYAADFAPELLRSTSQSAANASYLCWEQWKNQESVNAFYATVGSLLRVLVNVTFLFDSAKYPQHARYVRKLPNINSAPNLLCAL